MSETRPAGTQQIESEIEAQREHLADTVDQLAHKLDVKAQAKERAALVKERATTDGGKPRPELLVTFGSVVLLLSLLVWWRRR